VVAILTAKLRSWKNCKSSSCSNIAVLSILGLVLIGVALYLIIYTADYNLYLVSGMLSAGILLFFVPDKFINGLEKIVFGKEIDLGLKKKKDSDPSI